MQIPAWVRVNDIFIACLEFVCLDDHSRCTSQGLRNTLKNNPIMFWSSGASVNEDD